MIIGIQISFSKFQLSTVSDFSLLSSEASFSSSDSLDSFSNFDKLKPYDFEPTVSDNGNTDEEVSSSAMQTKRAEKGKCRLLSMWKMQGHVYQC